MVIRLHADLELEGCLCGDRTELQTKKGRHPNRECPLRIKLQCQFCGTVIDDNRRDFLKRHLDERCKKKPAGYVWGSEY